MQICMYRNYRFLLSSEDKGVYIPLMLYAHMFTFKKHAKRRNYRSLLAKMNYQQKDCVLSRLDFVMLQKKVCIEHVKFQGKVIFELIIN